MPKTTITESEWLREMRKTLARESSVASRPWTDDEMVILREFYGKASTKAIARRLGRTYGAVAIKALRMGLAAHRRAS